MEFVFRSKFAASLLLSFLLCLVTFFDWTQGLGEVIYAVNCGGGSHVDVYGIHYQKDPVTTGYSSDHGKNLGIRRVAPQDQILYQTERYHTTNFVYTVPIRTDGDYVLVVKFSEVWFTEPNRKVFDVQLNGQHTVVNHLDIYAVAGLGVAHDEIVPFSIKKGMLIVGKEASDFDGILSIEFVKLHLDNPKVNAIYVMRGKIEDVPQLPPIPIMDRPTTTEDDDDEEIHEKPMRHEKRRRTISESKVSDPYAAEDPSSMLLPVVIAIAAFVPIVFCLCRL